MTDAKYFGEAEFFIDFLRVDRMNFVAKRFIFSR
jgi:hypothetical protein